MMKIWYTEYKYIYVSNKGHSIFFWFRIFLLQFRWHFSFKCYEYLFMLTEHLIIELIQVKNTFYNTKNIDLGMGVFTMYVLSKYSSTLHNLLFTILFLGIQKDGHELANSSIRFGFGNQCYNPSYR